jgi:23S rRNA (uridine2552-2'-O)-methyltransferase
LRLEQAKRDYYRRRAKEEGYRSRAAFKLKQLNEKYNFIRSGYRVVDIGSAPGGWLEVSSELVGTRGKVVGIDLVPVQPVSPNVVILEEDVTSEGFKDKLAEALGKGKADCVLADLSPKLSGIWDMDHFRQIDLCHSVIDLLPFFLVQGGSSVMKAFQGEELQGLRNRLCRSFKRVETSKPAASRNESSEVYLVSLAFSGQVPKRESEEEEAARQSEELLDSNGFVQR